MYNKSISLVRLVLIFLVVISPLLASAQVKSDWFSWTSSGQLPVKEGLSHVQAGLSNGVLIVAGGANFKGSIQEGGTKQIHSKIYIAKDPKALVWEEQGDLPFPLANAAVVPYQDGLLFIGGTDGSKVLNSMLYVKWDAAQNKIIIQDNLPLLPLSLISASAAIIGNTIYLTAGQDDQGNTHHGLYSLTIEDFKDGGQAKWIELATFPGEPRFGAAFIAQSNGEYNNLYLFGGKGNSGYLLDAYKFDPKKKVWKAIADLPRPALFAPFLPMGQTHIALFSGSDGHDAENAIALGDQYHMVKDAMAYHSITDTWVTLNNIPTGVAGATAIKWNDQLLLIGGELRPGTRTAEVQIAHIQAAKETSKFGWIDYATLVLYLAILAGISIYFSKQKDASEDYLLGSKSIPYWAVGISIMATQVSAIGFMSIPAKAYAVNWGYFAGVFTWFIVVPIVTRAYIPFIRKLNVASAYHYLEARFNASARLFAASVFVLFQLARMGLVLYLPALALSAVTPLDTVTCIIIMGVLSTIYTVVGGFEAVIWIEVAQAILLFGGGLLCLILAIMGLNGGISDFFSTGIAEQKFSLGEIDWSFTSSTFVVILIGNVFIRLGNLTSDQSVVQRYMTTSTLKEAKRSVWADVWISIPWAIVIYALGTALFVFYKQNPVLINPSINTDGILPMFIAQQAPIGISGLIIAAIFAASMSTLEGSIHSVATIFTTDFYGRYKKDLNNQQIGRVAKIATLFLGVFATGLSLILVFMDINSILDIFQEITGLFIGASTALFLLGILTTRANATGAVIGAFSSGIILYFVKTQTSLNFWLYSAIGFLSCFIIGYIMSLLLPGKKELQGLTYYTINDNLKTK